MSLHLFDPPAPQMPARRLAERRADLLAEIERVETSVGRESERSAAVFRIRPRKRLLIVLAALILLAGVGSAIAVGVDLLAQQDRVHRQEATADKLTPQPHGNAVEIVSGADWSLLAWKSDKGICLDYAVPGNYVSGCGFPVVGALSESAAAAEHSPLRLVAGLEARPEQDILVVAGLAAASVERVDVTLADGRTLEAEVFATPSALETPVRVFLLRIPVDGASQTEDGPNPTARELHAYDSAGILLEESSTGFGS